MSRRAVAGNPAVPPMVRVASCRAMKDSARWSALAAVRMARLIVSVCFVMLIAAPAGRAADGDVDDPRPTPAETAQTAEEKDRAPDARRETDRAQEDPRASRAPDGQLMTASSSGGGNQSPTGTFTPASFQTDLFTGAATAEVPISVPPGTAGADPGIVLRYNSLTADELEPRDQAPWTGLGWTLDVGGFILRDTKNTTTLDDDSFSLVFSGVKYDLVLVDATSRRYRTKDETYLKVQYQPSGSGDNWTVTMKDGTQYRFGSLAGTKAQMRGSGGALVTYRYMLAEVVTTSNTAIRYEYQRETGTVFDLSYDRAIYPSRITYTYHNNALVGPAREVRFLRTGRDDWTNNGNSTTQAFFETQKLDAIEIRVGTSLVRKFAFTYDDELTDRDPDYTWGGGATGDLTLLSIIQYGSDGVTALPALSFSYSDGRLASVDNGIGGVTGFVYEHVATVDLWSACLALTSDGLNCAEWGVQTTPDSFGRSSLLGYALATNLAGTIPLYRACLHDDAATTGCDEWGVSTTPDAWGYSDVLGYVSTANPMGTQPLYSSCFWLASDGTTCAERGASTAPDAFGTSELLGRIYSGKLDRYRVASRAVNDGRGGSSTMTFTYSDLGIGPDGKEFRGHAAVRSYDPEGHYVDSWFAQEDVFRGRTTQVETRGADDALYTRIVNTWESTIPHPGVAFVLLRRADIYAFEGDTSYKRAADVFLYDQYGNVTQIQHLGDMALTGDERTEVTDYAPKDDPVANVYIVSLPAHKALLGSSGIPATETWFYYDDATSHATPPTQGRLTQRCDWLDTAPGNPPCSQMGYDNYGNVVSVTDARGNTTTTTYDSTHRTFPATVTTPATPNASSGLVTASTYDARFGVALTVTDPNNRTTTNTYDIFGRVISTRNALNETTIRSYDDIGIVGVQRVTTRVPDGSPDGLWSEEYFDGLGRTFKIRKKAAAGRVVVEETDYDARGAIRRQSLPRFEGTNAIWTSFQYDPLGRQTSVSHPDSHSETTAYGDWSVTATDRNGRSRTQVKDAYSRVTEVTEPGVATSTRFAYDAAGRLVQVTDSGENFTSITYDSLGRKTSMTEPNTGAWAYSYDGNGNLTSQTDAKGQTLTFEYDALNRLARKVYPVDPGTGTSPTVTYTYDTGTNGKGRRTGMTDLAGSASYTYDALGRLTSVTQITDGTAYTTQTTYTSFGQVGTITYPDGEVVTYTYDEGGRVRAAAGAQAYVNDVAYGAAGQILSLDYANGAVSRWTYDPLTLRLVRRQTGPARIDTTTAIVPLARWVKTWEEGPAGYAPVYAGAICLEYTTGGCAGGDIKAEPGHGAAVGFMKTAVEPETVAVYRAHCYATAAGTCAGWGLSLTESGTPVGYLSQTAPDTRSAEMPLAQAGNLLLRGLQGASAAAFVYTSETVPVGSHTDHVYAADGQAVPDYTLEGTTAHILSSADTGTAPLVRYLNAATGHHYYSTASDAPSGFASEVTLGHVYASAGSGRIPLYRHHNATTGDYLIDTSSAPPTGYVLQATLGYGAGLLQDLGYAYDPVGNITAITDHRDPGNSRFFGYDDLDRLTTASGSSFGVRSYAYDDLGNITSKAGLTYSYGETTRTCGRSMPHAVTGVSDGTATRPYTYDCNGNLVSDGQRTLVWNADDRPASVTRAGVGTTTFAYDGDGTRVKKVGPTRTVRYIGSFEAHVTDGVAVKNIVVGPLRVATRVTGGSQAGTYFTLADHLGSLEVLTDGQGLAVQRLTYLPYGETLSNTGTADFDQHRYTGQELDPETGLYYYGARYYDPELGRFLSADSIVPGPGNPQNLNRYSYANNNPIIFSDPTGHFSLKKAWRSFKRWVKRHEDLATFIGVAGQALGGGFLMPGTVVLTQTEAGRYIVGAEIIIASTVMSIGCGGCGAWATGAAFGSAIGGSAGAYAAYRAGGDISQGFLFGSFTGAVAGGLGGSASVYAQELVAKSGLLLKGTGYVLGGAVQGGLLGSASGAAVGYGGGTGDLTDILHGATRGLAYGAAGGAALGGLQFGISQWGELTAPEAWQKVMDAWESVKNGGGGLSRGKLAWLAIRVTFTEAPRAIVLGASFSGLQAATAWEMRDPFLEDLVRERLKVKGSHTIDF